MAEVVALASSVIAIIQIADRVVELCKFYIETAHDAPSDLRAILIETSTIKTILENLQFLISCNGGISTTPNGLSHIVGPIKGCRSAITEMEKLFPSDYAQGASEKKNKKQKVKTTLTALAWPLKERKARKLLEKMIQYKTTINLALTTESIHDIKDIRRQTNNVHNIVSESQKQEVYKWLQDTDPSPLHHRVCQQYEAGTGDWMLRCRDWIDWVDGKKRCLWIHGIPGAGKTVLFSHLVKKVENHCKSSRTAKTAHVYYYCYFGHNQDEAVPFLRWTINRLSRQAGLVPTCLYRLYQHGGQPSLVDLLQALEDVLKELDNVYIAIDAVDESMPREDLLRVIRDLVTDSRFQKVQLLATSREYIDIEKTMLQISTPVSMLNPLLAEDIKRYVRSQMHKNPRFKPWPPQLQDEVVEALGTGAKGMFRWAVCQIDVLQRLKGESRIVRNALANLPKTLDESYERIFLAIPDEHRNFVHYALKWICYVNELGTSYLSSAVLVQAIVRSLSESTASAWDYFYDEEVLREFCGCLITVIPECGSHVTHGVSLAHYTVLEFLTSTRILSSSAAFFAMEETTNLEMTRIAILEALDIHNDELWSCEPYKDKSYGFSDALEKSFTCYCVLLSVRGLRKLSHWLSQRDDLAALMFNLLDPSKPHYEKLKASIHQIDGILNDCVNEDFLFAHQFWDLNWIERPKNTDVVVLLSLLTMKVDRALVERFLRKISLKEVLQTKFVLNIETFAGECKFVFKGSIVQLFANLGNQYPAAISLLLELGIGFFDPSNILLSYIGSHAHENEVDDCPLKQLLQLGAAPNIPGNRVTLLQIAVACHDFQGTKTLLEAGADANDTGDRGGIDWEEGSFLARFNPLHGIRSLHICRELGCFGLWREGSVGGPATIEQMLLQYGARGF